MKLSGKPNLRKKPSFLRGGGGSVVRNGRRVRSNSRLGAQDACARDVGGAQLARGEAHRSQGGFGIHQVGGGAQKRTVQGDGSGFVNQKYASLPFPNHASAHRKPAN